MHIRRILCGLFIAGLVSSAQGSGAAPQKDAAAVAAAQKWLSKIDQGAYSAAWSEAASYFKNRVPQQTFSQQLEGVRKPLGKLISRKLISEKALTSAPGAPDGKYVRIQFSTSFSDKKSAVETITPMLDKDGDWRVSGYFIK